MIATTTISKQYTFTAGSAPSSFTIPFSYTDPSQIAATLSVPNAADVPLTYGVDYSVSAAGSSGTLTRLTTWDVSATTITIYRSTPLVQQTQLVNGQDMDAPTLETMFDDITQMMQESKALATSGLHVPITDPVQTMTIPDVATRANSTLGFDSSGNPIAATATTSVAATSFGQSVVTAADAGAAQSVINGITNVTTGATDSAQTVPLAQTVVGKLLIYTKVDSGAGKVVLSPSGSDTFSGMTSINLADQYDSVALRAIATGLYIIERQPVVSTARIASQNRKPLGELFYLAGEIKAASKWDFTAPSNHFPALCVDDDDHVITDTDYPLAGPELRPTLLKYAPGTSNEVSAFAVTNWSVATNTTATVTLDTSLASTAIVAALSEDNTVQGSYAVSSGQSWMTIHIGTAIGNIPVGYWPVTGIDAATRVITFTITSSTNGSGAVTATCTFMPYQLAQTDSNYSTSVRIGNMKGRALVSSNDANNEVIPGLRRRQRMQGHRHQLTDSGGNPVGVHYINTGSANYGFYAVSGDSNDSARDIKTDGANGIPNTGKTTHPDDVGAHLYMWLGQY